jgi:hypothetical protein
MPTQTTTELAPVAPVSCSADVAAAEAAAFIVAHLPWLAPDKRSDCVASFFYSAGAESLYVRHHKDPTLIYVYQGFTAETYFEFVSAPSLGSYYSRKIAYKYPTAKIPIVASLVPPRGAASQVADAVAA